MAADFEAVKNSPILPELLCILERMAEDFKAVEKEFLPPGVTSNRRAAHAMYFAR